jgi:hypothetical protein
MVVRHSITSPQEASRNSFIGSSAQRRMGNGPLSTVVGRGCSEGTHRYERDMKESSQHNFPTRTDLSGLAAV